MKNRLTTVTIILLFISLLSSMVSCTPQACLDETLSTAKATFYKTSTGKTAPPDSVTLFGLGKDTNIYSKALKPQIIKIPLNAENDTSVFIIKINTDFDTVSLVYSTYPHLISKECGFTFFHVLDTIYGTHPGIVFNIRNKNITTFNEENIRIFY